MKFGAHILIKGGLETVPRRAKRAECEVFQIFSRSPRGGSKPLNKDAVSAFKTACGEFGYTRWYVHAPYVMNLASPEAHKATYSTNLLIEELTRAETLGAKAVVTHLGSAQGKTHEEGLTNVARALKKIRQKYSGPVELLLEISAGAGALVGDRAEDFTHLQKTTGFPWNICLDSAHLFGSGYDLRTTTAVHKTLDRWDEALRLSHVHLLHLNDSKVPLDAHQDRHEHIGKGEIGLEGFRALVRDSRLRQLDAIIETPKEDEFADDIRNLRLLKSLRPSTQNKI